MKRSISFVSLKDQEQQQLEEFAALSFQQRFDFLKFLQKSFFHLHRTEVDVDDVGKKFLELPRKKNGY
jgi:hypothetical protein